MAPKRTSTPPLTAVSSIIAVPTPVAKVNLISGDSLEEDFLLEDDFVPGDYGSDDEAGAVVDTSTFVEEEEGDTPVKEQVIAEEGSSKKKRKLNNDDASVGSSKKISLREKKAQRILESTQDVASLGMLPPASLADRFAEKQKKALPKLSGMEFEEIRLQESMIVDTSHIINRSSLMAFIREGTHSPCLFPPLFLPPYLNLPSHSTAVPTLPSTLAKPPKKAGSPRVIVISGASLRVADLCREVKSYKTKEIDIAKLFSKHFKLEEHVEYLNKTKVGIAVGVPGRIGKLFNETDALSLTHLSHLILDVTHTDSKKNSLLDMLDSRQDLFKEVLGYKPLMERLREGRMKVIFW